MGEAVFLRTPSSWKELGEQRMWQIKLQWLLFGQSLFLTSGGEGYRPGQELGGWERVLISTK